jgi:hypothetical protein
MQVKVSNEEKDVTYLLYLTVGYTIKYRIAAIP